MLTLLLTGLWSPEPSSLFVFDENLEEKLFKPFMQTSEEKIMESQIPGRISQLQSEVAKLKNIVGIQEYRIETALIHICTCASFIFGFLLVALCIF